MSTRQPQEPWPSRFWAKADKSGDCWHWTGHVGHDGYGKAQRGRRQSAAHRLAYELHFGPIPAGLQIDHVCHWRDSSCLGGNGCLHRRCVNPAHLEAVTPKENVRRSNSPAAAAARRTHCPKGHPYDEANTTIERGTARRCRKCTKARHPGVSPMDRTHCPQGHEYTDENTYRTPEGYRKCRTCRRDERRRRHAEARALASPQTNPAHP